MGIINKERIIFIIALVIALYSLGTAFSGNISIRPVPDIPPPGGEHNAPSVNLVKVDFMDKDFNSYWGKYDFNTSRNPWIPSEKTLRPTPSILPMQEPSISSAAKVIPPTPYAPLLNNRPILSQIKPPVSIEEEQSEEEAEDSSDEEE